MFEMDMDQVSRVNVYGDAPKCVRDQFPHLRPTVTAEVIGHNKN